MHRMFFYGKYFEIAKQKGALFNLYGDPIRKGILRGYKLFNDTLVVSEGDFVEGYVANLGPMSECFEYAAYEGYGPNDSICEFIEVEEGPPVPCLFYPSNRQ